MSQWIGWIATALFGASYFFKHQTHLRAIQAAAATLWIGYGLSLGAMPVVVANAIVAILALVSIVRSPSEALPPAARPSHPSCT